MIKSVLTAGISVLALVATADARTFGHVAGNVNYSDFGLFSTDVDLWQYRLQGAVGFDVSPTWNVQFDAAYRDDSYPDDTYPGDFNFDSMRAGTQIFWRDPSKGMFGVEVAYQSVTAYDDDNDGYLVGLRGEYYGSDAYTLGGGLTYHSVHFGFGDGNDVDTTGGNLFATYYAGENIGVSLRTSYASTDANFSSGTQDIWTVGADVEYLFQNNLSVTGNVGYATNSYFGNGNDYDSFTVGAKLKFYFGTEGTLANQHRTSTLEVTPTDLSLLLID